ncbi:transposase [Legionella jordanis]|uniref:IS3 family transposase n=1 Tax=Legionella jordanis TaxID=456 RepID=A0A0W0V9R8_9GAMM|nr:transposase [Legionella jordanis]KTD16901.1 IS3 family transposase [Legionella jordanis]RMX00319.1 transposase [Legionella jordanis]VEH13598.1 IS3 element protein InsE; DLP12 prophage [Legionella jordanis]
MVRNVYTKEFKIKAIELLEQSNKSLRQIARELGVSENNLYNWRKDYRSNQEKAFPNQPQLDEKDLELRRLKACIAELEEEREILKKAAAFFAKEGQRNTR